MSTKTKFYRVDIDYDILARAKEIEAALNTKRNSASSTPVVADNESTGSICEAAFEKFCNDNFLTYTTDGGTITYGGDGTDITVTAVGLGRNLKIDVKGSKSKIDWDNKESNECLVFDHQLNKVLTGSDYIAFARIYKSSKVYCVYFLGVIETSLFREIAYPVKLKYDNHAVKCEDLTNLDNFLTYVNNGYSNPSGSYGIGYRL